MKDTRTVHLELTDGRVFILRYREPVFIKPQWGSEDFLLRAACFLHHGQEIRLDLYERQFGALHGDKPLERIEGKVKAVRFRREAS